MRYTELLLKILSPTFFMLIYANLFKNYKKCFFICWPILIFFLVVVSSGRTTWGTQKFYSKFWNFVSNIIYANLCKCIQNSQKILLLQKLTPFQWSTLPAGSRLKFLVFVCIGSLLIFYYLGGDPELKIGGPCVPGAC